jgi:hypothetical protein
MSFLKQKKVNGEVNREGGRLPVNEMVNKGKRVSGKLLIELWNHEK